MPGLLGLINRLLPFATPGTPIVQDLLHLAALCTALYYAPQIQSYFQTHSNQIHSHEENDPLPEEPQTQPRTLPHTPPAPFVEDASDSDSDSDDDINLPNLPEAPPQFGIPRQDIDDLPEPPAHGPANHHPTAPSSTRTIGAKKAKSLARKDQRRAYHEFMRSQGEAQRAQDAAGAMEREALASAERARRADIDAAVEAKRVKEREEKREREAVALREEMGRREKAVAIVKTAVQEEGLCELEKVAKKVGGGADGVWIERLVKASGLLGEKKGTGEVVVITEMGWVVRVGREDMQRAYQAVLGRPTSGGDNGRISYEELSKVLEVQLRSRIAT